MMEMCFGNRVKCIIFMCIAFTVSGVIYLGYFCPEKVCALTARNRHAAYSRFPSAQYFPAASNAAKAAAVPYAPEETRAAAASEAFARSVDLTYDDLTKDRNATFDYRKNDVIVFLHIQKTGGTTFGRHLVHDLDLTKPCECRRNGKNRTKPKQCKCIRPNSDNSPWLFSRFSTGWQCGLHADWTELVHCVDGALNKLEERVVGRRYFYISLLRDPIIRYLSEFLHVQRGATWRTARHWCGGHEATPGELPSCYEGDTWEDVTLERFMACPYNLATNRQTRMLADLSQVGCYNTSSMPKKLRDQKMLESAKENLRRMAYFGLCEFQSVSQYMFEESFNLHFLTTFHQYNETHVSSITGDINPEDLQKVNELNYLDVQLYEYAKELLLTRFEKQKQNDANFESHFSQLGKAHPKSFQWEDIEEEE